MRTTTKSKMAKSKIRIGLGKLGSRLLSNLSAEKKEVFDIRDAEAASGLKGLRLGKLLHNLVKNRWVERIERGRYLILSLESGLGAGYGIDSYTMARKLVIPYYIGFFSALEYYGITEQVSRTMFIVTIKRKRALRFHAQDYYFVTFPKKRFFGATEEWIGQFKFKISDLEKTLVDCLFMPEYSGGITEVIKAFRRKLDYEKLYEYALKMDNLATIKRLGYVLDALKIKTPITKKLLKKVGGGYCLLDTGGPKTQRIQFSKTGLHQDLSKIKYNKKWRVIENIPKEELMVEL